MKKLTFVLFFMAIFAGVHAQIGQNFNSTILATYNVDFNDLRCLNGLRGMYASNNTFYNNQYGMYFISSNLQSKTLKIRYLQISKKDNKYYLDESPPKTFTLGSSHQSTSITPQIEEKQGRDIYCLNGKLVVANYTHNFIPSPDYELPYNMPVNRAFNNRSTVAYEVYEIGEISEEVKKGLFVPDAPFSYTIPKPTVYIYHMKNSPYAYFDIDGKRKEVVEDEKGNFKVPSFHERKIKERGYYPMTFADGAGVDFNKKRNELPLNHVPLKSLLKNNNPTSLSSDEYLDLVEEAPVLVGVTSVYLPLDYAVKRSLLVSQIKTTHSEDDYKAYKTWLNEIIRRGNSPTSTTNLKDPVLRIKGLGPIDKIGPVKFQPFK